LVSEGPIKAVNKGGTRTPCLQKYALHLSP
jgi:hypothetical protein